MHRNTVVHAVVVAGLTAAPAAHATPATTGGRTVSASYAGSGADSPAAPVPAQYVSARGQGGEAAAVNVQTTRTDRSVEVLLADADGLPVLGAVVQHLGADARSDVELGRVCGGTARRFRLARAGAPLTVYLLAGRCPDGPSVPTTGTATLTFLP